MKTIKVIYVGPDATSPDLGPLTSGDVHELPADVLAGPNWTAADPTLKDLTADEQTELGLTASAKPKPPRTTEEN